MDPLRTTHIRQVLHRASTTEFLRDLLMDPELDYKDANFSYYEVVPSERFYNEVADAVRWADNPDHYMKDEISQLRLSYSLCPLHACDYAICFDDEDAECELIRRVFPCHDS